MRSAAVESPGWILRCRTLTRGARPSLLPSQADFGLCTVQIKNINSKTKECWEKKVPIIMKHVIFCRGRNCIFVKNFLQLTLWILVLCQEKIIILISVVQVWDHSSAVQAKIISVLFKGKIIPNAVQGYSKVKKHLPPQLSSLCLVLEKIQPRPPAYWLGEILETVPRSNFRPAKR